jgi:hypothetical protein
MTLVDHEQEVFRKVVDRQAGRSPGFLPDV